MTQVFQKIGLSFVQGLLWWLLIYIGIVHLFVVWKWDSGKPYAAPTPVNPLSAPTEPRHVMVEPSGELEDVVNPWVGHEETVTYMVQSFTEMQGHHQSVATTLEGQRTLLTDLNDLVQSSSITPWTFGDLAVETDDLEYLLRTTNLEAIPTQRLMIALPRINEALTEASLMYSNTQWEELDRFFRASYLDKKPSVADYVCPVPREVIGKPWVDPNAANITDLEHMVELIQKQISGSAILLETLEHLEESVRETIIKALDELIASLHKSPPGSTQCANEELLMELVEEGLLALRRRAPLRNVLKRKLLDMDPTAKSIILDADLPMTHPAIPQADTINLRQVLDTQLLSKASSWIDHLVDLCSGYNDSVDKFFDSIAGAGHAHAHVGEIVLQKAGKVDVPHPKRLLEKIK
jgi:hypothetical protein